MAASARVAYLARRAGDFGVLTGRIRVDQQHVRERKQKIVDSFRHGAEQSIQNTENLELIRGKARFIDARTVSVENAGGEPLRLKSERIFINTGAKPAVPQIPGLHETPFLDSTSIMELNSLPRHLVILGGGYVAIEFGQMFRRYGSRVTIIERGEQLLRQEDPDVSAEVAGILEGDGIEIRLNTEARRVKRSGKEGVQLTLSAEEKQNVVRGSHLLVAVGRSPNTDALNLAVAGVKVDDKGYIVVNGRLETNVPGIYALGDVKPGPAFTHISYDDFRVLQANVLQGGNATIEGRLVPYTVFMDPQLGRVGLSEKAARAQGRNIRVAKLPMSHVARAIEFGETRGFLKAVLDADTDQILGCAALGMEGGEIMAVFQVAMMGKLPYTALRDGIFSHPTLAEALNNLFLAKNVRGPEA
jgi:pyruvate/2-oxoglutarate dehydrogenase complex dihydrolipoamide dehydrogenase (E3) component